MYSRYGVITARAQMPVLPSAGLKNGLVGGLLMAEDSGNSFVWFILGLGIGAVAGVLYAPQSGRETREMLAKKCHNYGRGESKFGPPHVKSMI